MHENQPSQMVGYMIPVANELMFATLLPSSAVSLYLHASRITSGERTLRLWNIVYPSWKLNLLF